MRPRNVLLIYPRFLPTSFWVFTATCEAIGKRCPAPPLGLVTVAALLPAEWTLRLVDCNAEQLDEAELDWADLVLTGGMLTQQRDTLDIIGRCRARGLPVAVGGPDATTSPHAYANADFLILGEVEPIVADFAAAVDRGAAGGRFEAEPYQTDIGTAPIPRFDLLDFRHYLRMAVQFSRGCPFTCEFCDIIELFGRVPRVKSPPQMLAELDALYRAGWRGHVDFVDDNLIGNKKALKIFLPQLAGWLRERGYPFEFSTQASLNLADDGELLALLRRANFFLVFIGIESADDETLVATRKKQNARRDIAESVHKVHAAGMIVTAGFIVGFDTEKVEVASATAALIEEAAIPACMIGLLSAFPNTQLSRRLQREGRLAAGYEMITGEQGDMAIDGLNFRTLRPRGQVLADCQALIRDVYPPERYFGRIRRMARALDCGEYRPAVPLGASLSQLWGFIRHAMLPRSEMRGALWATVIDCLRHNPRALHAVMRMALLYLHFGPFSRHVVAELERRVRTEAPS